MATYTSLFRAIIFFFSRILHEHFKTPRYLHRKVINALNPTQLKLQKYPSFIGSYELFSSEDDDDKTLIFNVEDTLLKSSSLFPYFMLVAFEGGSILRALLLLILYPLICLFNKEMGLKIMVMVSFFGIKKDGFIVGRAVLPKFFLEDVGLEGFEVVRKCKRKMGVSELPHVMVESFVREYLEVDFVVGKELKEIYLTNEEMKSKWKSLQSENYPKPLIFHDGRLALRPTPTSTLTLFLWLPFGIFLAIFRGVIALSLPKNIANPILTFTGLRLLTCASHPNPTSPNPKSSSEPTGSGQGHDQGHASHPNPTSPNAKSSSEPTGLGSGPGQLYVCNHKTLLDPLYLSYALNKPLTAVTYSLSRVSEILAPIKTVRLTRDRDQDGIMMEKLLNQGDLVVCPEGTTCREPFLLRFSSLFAEMNDQITPVAMDCHVSMFYGTTASGLKCLDPIFFLMNPRPSYTVRLLGAVSGLSTCQDRSQSGFDVANHVQREIGESLNFQCTKLTRKDKYMILAGNNGVV
ncbi:hypothetical protein SOVF_052720 [Spinacia oleracea]|nr:hypothetical protein SOVF_052720 [Spinacia oleracea]